MPDYNPDKERHAKHKFIVQDAWPRQRLKRGEKAEVKTDKGNLPFDKEGRFALSDEGLARAIQQEYPGEVAVTRVRHNDPADRGHTYVFTMPAMPWHKYDPETGKRIDNLPGVIMGVDLAQEPEPAEPEDQEAEDDSSNP